MKTKTQPSDPASRKPAAANAGRVRPPLVYLISLVAGIIIQLIKPLPLLSGFLPRRLTAAFGGMLIVTAVSLFLWAVRTFRRAGTPIPGNKPTTVIVRTGPYRFSRNPIYLAFSLFEIGIAICANSLWLLATLAGAMLLMNQVVIRREERYLEQKFGEQYLDYKATVRRWL